MRKTALLIVCVLCVLLTGCGEGPPRVSSPETQNTENSSQINTEQAKTEMKITINGKSFEAELYDTEAAADLAAMLPLTLNMNELNGNEKYSRLEKPLKTNTLNVKRINEGDIMLFGDNCLVVFYKSFTTSYAYTKIGHITDTSSLAEALGKGNVKITFE